QSKPSTFVADSSTAKVSGLTVTTGALANGTATNQATVTVVDGKNNPVAGQDVTWSQDGTAVVGTSAKTDNNGQTTVTFTDLKAQTVNITATVNGTSQSKPSTFVADSSTAKVSDLTVTTGAIANGTATNQATVTVVDAKGNGVAGQDVTWSQDGTAVVGTSAKTDRNGQTTVTFTDLKAETVNITAKASSLDPGVSKPSSFIADATTAHVTLLVINVDNSTANGTSQNQAIASVMDANGNAVVNSTVTWSVDGGALLTAGTSQTNENGQAIMTLTSTKALTVSLSARVGNTTAVVQNTTFTFIVDHLIVDVVTEGHGGPNSSIPNTIRVSAFDIKNQLMPGVNVTFRDNNVSINVGFSPSQGITDATGSLVSDVRSSSIGSQLLVAETTNSQVTQKTASVSASFSNK
ncbi:Ig-like domain-containing protein, partial [Hafnia alvei]|uniref:Ig-like domain-containing protein n=1 Tax=Hafnia alvei TaxID=569 RepID=UPI001428EC29